MSLKQRRLLLACCKRPLTQRRPRRTQVSARRHRNASRAGLIQRRLHCARTDHPPATTPAAAQLHRAPSCWRATATLCSAFAYRAFAEASVGALTQCLLDTCLTGNEAQCARVQVRRQSAPTRTSYPSRAPAAPCQSPASSSRACRSAFALQIVRVSRYRALACRLCLRQASWTCCLSLPGWCARHPRPLWTACAPC